MNTTDVSIPRIAGPENVNMVSGYVSSTSLCRPTICGKLTDESLKSF